jgi:hypothetical protein
MLLVYILECALSQGFSGIPLELSSALLVIIAPAIIPFPQDTLDMPVSARAKQIIPYLSLIVFLAGVGLFIYLGVYNRYWADDWCYNADFRNKGFIESVKGYSYDVTYTPSRYSVTIFAGLIQAFQVLGVQLMTPLTILFWVAGLFYLFHNISLLTGYRLSKITITTFSLLIVYFSIYLTEHIYQSVYWRTGTLTYTSPMVFLTWIFAFITAQALREQPSVGITILCGILAFLGGGFSEAGTTVMVSMLGLYVVVAAFVAYRYKHSWAVKSLVVASVALFFALAAMAMLIFSPTTQIRKGRYGEPASLPMLLRLVFNFTYAFFVAAVKNYQYLVIFALSSLFGILLHSASGRNVKPIYAFILAGVIFSLAILFVAASLAPSAYVEKGIPAPRTMIIPRFIIALGFVLSGWFIGVALCELLAMPWLEPAASVLLVIALVFPIYTLNVTAQKIQVYSQRTQLWDDRNQMILTAIENGQSKVQVLAIDGLPVGGIRDFDPNGKKGFWITKCAMDYYSIRIQPLLP